MRLANARPEPFFRIVRVRDSPECSEVVHLSTRNRNLPAPRFETHFFNAMSFHWDLSEIFDTAQASEPLGDIPKSISLDISLGTKCGNCHKPVNYVRGHAEQKGTSAEWLDDDGSPNCSVPVQGDKARKASPVAIPNDALFAELQKYDCR